MPLDGSFTASQTNNEVKVSVPLKGSSVRSLDIFSTENYVKVNFPPYIAHVDLNGIVDASKGIATITDGVLELAYPKKQPGLWESALFVADSSLTRKEKQKILRDRRSTAAEKQRLAEKEQQEQVQQRKATVEKLATKKQMELDDRARNHLDDLKEEEKKQAEDEVYETLTKLGQQAALSTGDTMVSVPGVHSEALQNPANTPDVAPSSTKSTSVPDSTPTNTIATLQDNVAVESTRVESLEEEISQVEEESNSTVDPKELIENTPTSDPQPTEKPVPVGSEQNAIFSERDLIEQDVASEDGELEEYIPAPRETTSVKLAFTPRVFPTPMRESKAQEEEVWIMKNRRHLDPKMRKRLEDTQDISERDPYWLKSKGDDFFRAGDFSSAVGAYSCAIEIDPAHVGSLANRAACHLKLGLHDRCVEDCTSALRTAIAEDAASQPAARTVQSEAEFVAAVCAKEARVTKRRVRELAKRVLVRRGTALCGLGRVDEALQDYQAAEECDPADPALGQDCRRLALLVQARAVKDQADAAVREGRIEEARVLYSRAIEHAPGYVPALANRAAALVRLGELEGAVEDCEEALEVLGAEGGGAGGMHVPIDGYQPAQGSDQWKKWRLGVLARRGGALFRLARHSEALSDFNAALLMSPDDARIARNIARIQSCMRKEEAVGGGPRGVEGAGADSEVAAA